MKLNVQQLIGDLCMTGDEGAKLHNAYRAAFDSGDFVELDFTGTRIFLSRFFNAAVGQLLKEHSLEEVRRRLHCVNLPFAGAAPLRQSMENAEERHFRDPKFQAALDRVLEAQAAVA